MGASKERRLAEARGEIEHQEARFERTFNEMRPWLPATADDFLDIGCGTGAIAVQVARHYRTATAHLIEGTEDRAHGAWHTDGRPWRDVRGALAAFAKHCPEISVRSWPPRDDAPIPPCELVYSTCSLGHHYPVETYLGLLQRTLMSRGRLIIDLRIGEIGEHGRAVLREHFTHKGDIAATGKKYWRTVWERG